MKIPPCPISDRRSKEIRDGSPMTQEEKIASAKWYKERSRVMAAIGKMGGPKRAKVAAKGKSNG